VRTEFFCSYPDTIKTFEIEEIPDNCFEHYYFNKYVHGERESECKIFRHLDGAAKFIYKIITLHEKLQSYQTRTATKNQALENGQRYCC
jgi:hypothetical protein